MLPSIFYEYYAQEFNSFGIGVLSDTITCYVEEERNGQYELEMTYPATGAYADQIKLKRIITAKPNYTDFAQPFRIYYISRPLNGILTIKARHLCYDLCGFIAGPFTASGITEAMSFLTSTTYVEPSMITHFQLSSNISSSAHMTNKFPQSVKSLMGGVRGSMLDVYGGEWHFDGKTAELLSARGQDRGVVIQYGKNLTDIKQTEEDTMYMAVYPYYYNQETGELVTMYPKLLFSNQSGYIFLWQRVRALDLTEEFETTPTPEQLHDKAVEWREKNDFLSPNVNLKLSFVQIDQLTGNVNLCDTVTIKNSALGIETSAKCIRTKWNVLLNRYDEIEIGTPKLSLGNLIPRYKGEEHYYWG